MNVDTQNDIQRKLTQVILKKNQNQIAMNPLKAKEIEIHHNQNYDESLIRKHKELQNLWSQYFRDGKTERDLNKERPPFLLKRKLSIIFSKDSERKEHTLEKKIRKEI